MSIFLVFYFLMVLFNWEMAEMAEMDGLNVDQNYRPRLLKRAVSDKIISPMFINQETGRLRIRIMKHSATPVAV